MSKHWLLVCVFCLALLPTPAIAEDDAQDTFTLSGSVFTSSGDEAGTTYIKVDSSASVPSENGVYSFPGITPGEHTVRAYFMNDGHTVAYRTVYIQSESLLSMRFPVPKRPEFNWFKWSKPHEKFSVPQSNLKCRSQGYT